MKAPTIYLYFSGNCEEAFDFYQEIFGGEMTVRSRYKDMPPNPDLPPIAEELKELIMHSTLTIGKGAIIQGADLANDWAPPFQVGNNFAVSLTADSTDHADQIHTALSSGGRVTMEMQKTFWGSYFGSCVDQFGVTWMIAFGADADE